MSKYKATINIERELWDKFRDYCASKNVTATSEITAFIKTALLQDGFDIESNTQFNESPALLKELLFQVTQHAEDYCKKEFNKIGKNLEQRIEEWLETKEVQVSERVLDKRPPTKTESKTDDKEKIYPPLFSDRQVAEIEGVSPTTICRYRKGKRKPEASFELRWIVSDRDPKRWEKWADHTRKFWLRGEKIVS